MTAHDHYANHLGNFYSWMVGDFVAKQQEQQIFLERLNLQPALNKVAIDLGCGHGLQSVSLARMGYQVKTIDFNEQLLDELHINASGLAVEIHQDAILNISNYAEPAPELIVCMGDTLTHLDSKDEILNLIVGCYSILEKNGKLVLSFRDYSQPLNDTARFIPVKSDANKILTCFLEYFPDKVRVTDLFHEKSTEGWTQKASSYFKVRISTAEILNMLQTCKMNVIVNDTVNRLQVVIASK